MTQFEKPEIVTLDPTLFAKPSRSEKEIFGRTIELASELEVDRIPIFIEIGVFEARNSAIIIKCVNQLSVRSRFLAFDLNPEMWEMPTKKYRGWKPSQKFEEMCEPLRGICQPRFVEGVSYESIPDVVFGDVVWCLVDGCHCFDCVTKDVEVCVPRLVPGGFILFHDTRKSDAIEWYHDKKKPRKIEVRQAIEKSEILKRDCELVLDAETKYGVQVWCRRVS